MTQKDNILQELKELNSSLSAVPPKEVYSVPAGYFEALAQTVLQRIKALETKDPGEELGQLSSLLSTTPKQVPYTVPAGYFESLPQALLQRLQSTQTAAEELESISPLLSQLKKENPGNPYTVPAGYFESIPAGPQSKPVVRVISITRRTWFRAAVAAVVTGVIVLAGYMFLGKEKEPGGKALAKFTRDIRKMDDAQKSDLMDFIDAGLSGKETAQVNTESKTEVKNLLEGISEEELTDFKQQTEDIQDVLLAE